MANQKYSSLVFPNLYALIASPQQYKGARVMIIELIRMAIGINAKTKNNCRANLFMVIGEHIYPRPVKQARLIRAKQEKSKPVLE